MLFCLAFGFSSGLPLWLSLTLVQAWLRREGVSLSDIGLFNLTGLPYTWKFLWAPLVDRFRLPFLGRRQGWALGTQVLLTFGIAAFGLLDPVRSPASVALLAVVVAFFSATQDIAVDAYRRELLSDRELGLGTAMHVNAYRLASLVTGGLALVLADHLPWSTVFLCVAGFMSIGIVASLLAPDGERMARAPDTLLQAVVGPIRELLARRERSAAVLVLTFLLLYKVGDAMAAALVTPFYLDVGFSLTEVGTVAKGTGTPATIVGLFLGGFIISRIGINKSLWVFGVLQMVSTLGYALLARIGPSIVALASAVGFEYLASGLGTAAFGAFMARATDQRFTATQFALFSAVIAIPRSVASASTGYIVEALGYETFFILCAVLALPGMLLLFRVAPWSRPPEPPPRGLEPAEPEPEPRAEPVALGKHG
jgi:MFS transporter, PAT family, beta-lactamase induction signal transducer AmpG